MQKRRRQIGLFPTVSIWASLALILSALAGLGPAPQPTLTGLDVLQSERFSRLEGKRVALLTNHTGRSRAGVSTIDLLLSAPGVRLVALFSPEHGIRGEQDELVLSSRDEKTGLPIHSLYGETRRPAPAILAGLDVLVVDIQDIGARFYTYPATLAYLMEAAAPLNISVMVLDRPNPIGGEDIEGPVQDLQAPTFTGYLPMPIRHGLTLGELARAFNVERRIGADLTVVPMKNWSRREWFDETRLAWIAPSPNIRNLSAAILYPGIGAIEGTNISVGRGTDRPFEQVGAPWVNAVALAESLNARRIAGVTFSPVTFRPARNTKLGGQACQGVSIRITDRTVIRPVRVGIEIASALSRLSGARFTLEDAARLLGSQTTIDRIRSGDDPADIAASWTAGETGWRTRRAPYLLY